MGVTTTSLNNVLEEVDLKEIVEIMYNARDELNLPNTSIYDHFGKTAELVADEEYFSVEVGGPESFGPHTEGGTVQKEGEMSYEQGKITQAEFSGGFEITIETIKKSNARGIGKAENIVDRIMKRVIHNIDNTLDYNFASEYSDGSGKMAQANGAGAATATLVVDNPGVVGQFRKGQRIDIYLAAAKEVDGIAITDVDPINNTLTLASTQTWTDDAYVYRKGHKDNMFDGLVSIVGTGTFQDINPAAGNSWWKAWQEIASGALEFSDIDLFMHNIVVSSNGPYPDCIVFDNGTKRKLNSLNLTDRALHNVTEARAGFKLGKTIVTDYHDVPYILNKYWATNMMFALNKPDIERYEFVPIEWFKVDNKILLQMTGKLDFEAKYFLWFNYGIMERNLHGKMSGYTV